MRGKTCMHAFGVMQLTCSVVCALNPGPQEVIDRGHISLLARIVYLVLPCVQVEDVDIADSWPDAGGQLDLPQQLLKRHIHSIRIRG